MVSGKQAKKTRQEAREQARKLAERSRRRSTNWAKILIPTVAVLAVGAVFAWIVLDGLGKQEAQQALLSDDSPTNTINDGWVVTADGLMPNPAYPATQEYTEPDGQLGNNVTMYVDYDCPHCAQFEEANGPQLEGWLADGTLDTVTINPMAFMSPYSMQAANVAACVAEHSPSTFLGVHNGLMANQGGGSTIPSETVDSILEQSGTAVTSPLSDCISAEAYTNFITEATMRAQQGPLPGFTGGENGVSGTPFIAVNGQRYTGGSDPVEFMNTVLTVTEQDNSMRSGPDIPSETVESE